MTDTPSDAAFPEGVASRTVNEYGVIQYRDAENRLHNPDGPAFIHPDKATYWLVTGRDPSEKKDQWFGYCSWWLHGKRHRTDGPAVRDDGRYEFWVGGRELTENEFRHRYLDKCTIPATDGQA